MAFNATVAAVPLIARQAAATGGRAMTEARYAGTKHTMLIFYSILYSGLWYDWATTLPEEYQKIWKSKALAAKYLFLLNRYLPLVTSIFIFVGFGLEWTWEKCNKDLLGWEIALPSIGAAAGGMLLLMRCYAIWSRSKKILAFLIFAYAGRLAGVIYFSVRVTTVRRPEGMIFGPCIPRDGRGTMSTLCLIPLAYDIIVCGLFLFRAFQLRRRFPEISHPVLYTITKHGCLYLIAIVLTNMLHYGWMKLSMRLDGVRYAAFAGAYICFAFESIFAARLMLASKSEEGDNNTCTSLNNISTSNHRSQCILSSRTGCPGKSRIVSEVPLTILATTTTLTTRDDEDMYPKRDRAHDEDEKKVDMTSHEMA